MKNLSLMIKPASGLCNMRCAYCFYCDISEKRDVKHFGFTDDTTMHNITEKALKHAQESVSFVFQGGEPSLAGLDFFEKFTKKVNELNSKKLAIGYSLQTNGLALDEEMIKFFAKHNFLLGLSLDGDPKNHNLTRLDSKGYQTHARVLKTADLLSFHKIPYNILIVVTRQTARHIERIYTYLKGKGFRFLQFIPCLAPLGEEPYENIYSPRPSEYENYLKKLFKLYYEDYMAGSYVSIRFFDNLVRIAMGAEPEQCGLFGACPGQFVIEADGSVYPCDFYCVDHWRLGSINEMSFAELASSAKMKEFINTSLFEAEDCRLCEYAELCRGGCRRDRDSSLAGVAGKNIYCDALYAFFEYAAAGLEEIAHCEKASQI